MALLKAPSGGSHRPRNGCTPASSGPTPGWCSPTELGAPVNPRAVLRAGVQRLAARAGIYGRDRAHPAAQRGGGVAGGRPSCISRRWRICWGTAALAITGDIYGHTPDDAATRAAVDGLSGVPLGCKFAGLTQMLTQTSFIFVGFRSVSLTLGL